MINRLGLLAALMALVVPAYASATGRLIGTWECQVAGAPPTKTPPILWFGEASSEGKRIDKVVDLDAFGRTASGVSDLESGANGWWKVQPQDGAMLMVKPLPSYGKETQAAMLLKLGQASYNCRRLPRII